MNTRGFAHRAIVPDTVRQRTSATDLARALATGENGTVQSVLWEPVDDLILRRRNVQAIKAIRDAHGGSLHEAIELFDQRWAFLQRERPNDFIRTATDPQR